MKQKIVINVYMNDEKTRRKALKTIVSFPGVASVALKGERRDQVKVKGEGIDAVNLTRALRKKVAHAELVEHIIEDDSNQNNNNDDDDSGRDDANNTHNSPVVVYPQETIGWPYTHYPMARYEASNDNDNNVVDPCCIIM